jgi:hypothetical protein
VIHPKNPYRPQPGSEPPALIGRDAETASVRAMLRAARVGGPLRPTVFTGLRGMGKTALLRHCLTLAREDDAVVLEVEASPDVPLAVALADSIADAKRQVSFSSRIRDIFDKLRQAAPTASIDLPGDMGSIELGLRASTEPTSMRHALEELNAAVRKRELYLVIAIDEIQESQISDLRELIKLIHASAGTELPIIFLGAGLTNSAQHLHQARTYTERWRYPRLECLSPAETIEAIQRPAQAQGVTFDDAALAALVTETAGYPFFIQEYASVVWANTDAATVTRADVDAVIPAVRSELDEQFYTPRFERLTAREMAYALALAELGPGAHPVHAVAHAFGLESSKLSSLRNQLVKKDVVFASAPGMVEFRMPLSEIYVARNRTRLERRTQGSSI